MLTTATFITCAVSLFSTLVASATPSSTSPRDPSSVLRFEVTLPTPCGGTEETVGMDFCKPNPNDKLPRRWFEFCGNGSYCFFSKCSKWLEGKNNGHLCCGGGKPRDFEVPLVQIFDSSAIEPNRKKFLEDLTEDAFLDSYLACDGKMWALDNDVGLLSYGKPVETDCPAKSNPQTGGKWNVKYPVNVSLADAEDVYWNGNKPKTCCPVDMDVLSMQLDKGKPAEIVCLPSLEDDKNQEMILAAYEKKQKGGDKDDKKEENKIESDTKKNLGTRVVPGTTAIAAGLVAIIGFAC